MKEQLHRVLVPVLLGDSFLALRIALKLHKRYGVISHLYCTQPGLLAHLCSCVRIVRTPPYLQGELLCTDLRAFAKEYPDLLFCLIPCTEEGKVFCVTHAAELEAYFLIVDAEQLVHGMLPYLSKEDIPV